MSQFAKLMVRYMRLRFEHAAFRYVAHGLNKYSSKS